MAQVHLFDALKVEPGDVLLEIIVAALLVQWLYEKSLWLGDTLQCCSRLCMISFRASYDVGFVNISTL